MKISPLLMAALQPTPKAKKTPRKVKTGESGPSHTQVGESPAADGPKVAKPTHAAMTKEMAKQEKMHATRNWISGHLKTKDMEGVHRRANAVIKGHKLGR